MKHFFFLNLNFSLQNLKTQILRVWRTFIFIDLFYIKKVNKKNNNHYPIHFLFVHILFIRNIRDVLKIISVSKIFPLIIKHLLSMEDAALAYTVFCQEFLDMLSRVCQCIVIATAIDLQLV